MRIDPNRITEANRGTVKEFFKWTKGVEGLSQKTGEGYYYAIRKLDQDMGKPFEDIQKDEMTDWVISLRDSHLSEATIGTILTRIKRFYKWLLADPNGGEYPPVVREIKVPRPKGNTLPEDIITPSEVLKMINACDHPQDRAIISTLYESGLRASEFIGLNKGAIEFSEQMGRIILPRDGEGQKTGQRRVPIINSVPYLQEWLNQHPLEGRKSPLWISLSSSCRHERIGYPGLRKKTKRIGRDAGIDKNTRPHIFRHSRATEIAKKGIYSEAEMRILFGWTKDSDQPSRYIHLAGADLDEKFKREHGIIEEEEEEEEKPLEPVECPRCEQTNPPTSSFCSKCGLALSLETVREIEAGRGMVSETLRDLLSDPEFRRTLKSKLMEVIEERFKEE